MLEFPTIEEMGKIGQGIDRLMHVKLVADKCTNRTACKGLTMTMKSHVRAGRGKEKVTATKSR